MSVEQSVQQLQIAAMGHLQAGRLTEADAACRELLSRTPDDGNALQMLGIISHQMGHVDAAIGFLQRAVAINPQAAGHQINLGSVLASAGRVSEALDAFAKAVRLRPDLPEGQYNLSKALFESGQIDQAKEAARQSDCVARQLRRSPQSARTGPSITKTVRRCGKCLPSGDRD